MKEQLHNLQQQLATDGTHVHYHDNRVIILIQNVPMDLAKIKEPIPLMWYNRHTHGRNKYTQVFLGAQLPKKHPSGEWMLDLLENEDQKQPGITGIFPRHLELPPPKRQRRW